MGSNDDNLVEDAAADSFSLESILAEYKGSAFINGDKKTPPKILQEETERIVREATGNTPHISPDYTDDYQLDSPSHGRTAAPPAAPDYGDAYQQEQPSRRRAAAPSAAPDYGDTYQQEQPSYRRSSASSVPPGFEDVYNYEQSNRARTPTSKVSPDYTGVAMGGADAYKDIHLDFDEPTIKEDSNVSQPVVHKTHPNVKVRRATPEYTQERTPNTGNAYPGIKENQHELSKTTDESKRQSTEEKDSVILFFENYRSPVSESADSIAQEVEKAVQKEIESDNIAYDNNAYDNRTYDNRSYEQPARESRIFDYSEAEGEGLDVAETEVFDEPSLRDATIRFMEAFNFISLRCIPAALVTIIMVILTFAFEAGSILPLGIGRSYPIAVGTLLLGLLIVMILFVDLIVRCVESLIKGVPNVETLLLFSCVFSILSSTYSMLAGSSTILPYCAVSAFSLTFAAVGERYNLRAFTETLKTAASSNEPYGLQAEYNKEIDKSVLKKAHNRIDGFYSNMIHPDVGETAYRYATPILLVAALVLSIFTTLVKGHGEYFLHIMSALFAATAPFSAIIAFALPYCTIAKTSRRSGTAIAGWGGADDICFTDGACVTDDDLFPPGTLSLSGLKLYEGVPPEKAIRYTASLVIASGSGLSTIFSELLKSQAMNPIKIEDFTCYEGGIGALIRGERVATGSAGFMNLLGFRIPDDMNMKNAVYTAVNDKLIAVFAVDYTPINSVQSALISILKWRIKLFFAVRDFNVTPSMLEQKFRVSLEDFTYVDAKDSYSISDSYSGKEGRMAAILTREGFGPFAEAVTGGRLLKTSALVATALSVISAAIGVIMMFYMCWSGSFESARPGNLILFMLSMLAAVLVVCGYVRFRK